MTTRQATTHLVATTDRKLRSFRQQMTSQAEKFGAELRRLREANGLNQRQVVEAMHDLGDQTLSTNQLSRYEAGGAMPGEERLARFAVVLDTSPIFLRAGIAPGDGVVSPDRQDARRSADEVPPDALEALRAEISDGFDRLHNELEDLRSLIGSADRKRTDSDK